MAGGARPAGAVGVGGAAARAGGVELGATGSNPGVAKVVGSVPVSTFEQHCTVVLFCEAARDMFGLFRVVVVC
ncbi:hypothetical protein CIP107518_02391 [Corynebacterium diphtheriae]|nr:hypothetical protein CIP107518_02391 [Corynebacterium diphtheriae]